MEKGLNINEAVNLIVSKHSFDEQNEAVGVFGNGVIIVALENGELTLNIIEGYNTYSENLDFQQICKDALGMQEELEE